MLAIPPPTVVAPRWLHDVGGSPFSLLLSSRVFLVCSIDLLRILVRISFCNFHWAEPFAPSRSSSGGGLSGAGVAEAVRGVENGGRAGGVAVGGGAADGQLGSRSDHFGSGALTATWVEFCGGFHAEAAKNTFTPSDYETEERDSHFRFQFDRLEAGLTPSARPTRRSPSDSGSDRSTEAVHFIPAARSLAPLPPRSLSCRR